MEVKPCPFCGEELERVHEHYVAINGKIADYDYYAHPLNECILADKICEAQCLTESDLKRWNERVCL